MNTYARLPVAFSHGSGSRVTDTEGKPDSTGCRESPSTRWATTILRWSRQLPPRPAGCCIRRISIACRSRNNWRTNSLLYRNGRKCSSATPDAKPTKARWRAFTAISVSRQSGHHRHGAFVSWPHIGNAFGDRQSQGSGGVRAARLPDSYACRSTIWKWCGAISEHNKNVVAVMLEIVFSEGIMADLEYQCGLRNQYRNVCRIWHEVQCGMGL